jgi:CDP-glucose 4,6-dehydratase
MDERPVLIRSPYAIRPWQHVLEPLRGYLAVAESMCDDGIASGEAWNFGPERSDAQPVEWIVRELIKLWGNGARWEPQKGVQPHEAHNLKLDWSKAAARLGWRPELRLEDALAMTVSWYKAKLQGQDMHVFTNDQIRNYNERSQSNTKIKQKSSGVHA